MLKPEPENMKTGGGVGEVARQEQVYRQMSKLRKRILVSGLLRPAPKQYQNNDIP